MVTGIISEGEIAWVAAQQRNVQVLLGNVTHIDLPGSASSRNCSVTPTKTDSLIVAAVLASLFRQRPFRRIRTGMKSIDDALELRSHIERFRAADRNPAIRKRRGQATRHSPLSGWLPPVLKWPGQIAELAEQYAEGRIPGTSTDQGG